jgi:hypothetical protein
MVFLVISTPRRASASRELVEARLAFRKWITGLKKRVIFFSPRKERGAVVILKLGSRRELDGVLRKWRAFVRARLEVYPLEDPAISVKVLEKKLQLLKGKR